MSNFEALFLNMTFLLVGKIDQNRVRQKAQGTSAQFASDVTKKTTHVLAPSNAATSQFGGKKFEKAVQSGIPVIDVEWFYESVRVGRTLPTSGYVINVSASMFENGGEYHPRPSGDENALKKRRLLSHPRSELEGDLGFEDKRSEISVKLPTTPGSSQLTLARSTFTPRPSPGNNNGNLGRCMVSAVQSVFRRIGGPLGHNYTPSQPRYQNASVSPQPAGQPSHNSKQPMVPPSINFYPAPSSSSSSVSTLPAIDQVASPTTQEPSPASALTTSPSPTNSAGSYHSCISNLSSLNSGSIILEGSPTIWSALDSEHPGPSLPPPPFLRSPLKFKVPDQSVPLFNPEIKKPIATLPSIDEMPITSQYALAMQTNLSSAVPPLTLKDQTDPFDNPSFFTHHHQRPAFQSSSSTCSLSSSSNSSVTFGGDTVFNGANANNANNATGTSSSSSISSLNVRSGKENAHPPAAFGPPAPSVGRKSFGGGVIGGGGINRPTASSLARSSPPPFLQFPQPIGHHPCYPSPRRSEQLLRPPPLPAVNNRRTSFGGNTKPPVPPPAPAPVLPSYLRRTQPVFHNPQASRKSPQPPAVTQKPPPPQASTLPNRAPRMSLAGGCSSAVNGMNATSRLHQGLPSQKPVKKAATKEEDSPLAAKIRNSEYIRDKINEAEWRAIMSYVIEADPNAKGKAWDSVSGLENCKSILNDVIILPSLRPDVFTGLLSPPKGLLLFGPPGNGKTMLAKAVVDKCKCTLIAISASAVTSKFVGDGEKLMRALFAVARALQPTVIFMDEVDALLSTRSQSDHEASKRLKGEYLVQMDGVGSLPDDRVLVMGATNRPHELDDAAIRRYTKRVYVPMPCAQTRREMFNKQFERQNHYFTEEDWNTIVAQTDGYSGSDIASLCREMAMQPIKEIRERILEVNVDEIRPMNINDFTRSLQNIRPSISPDLLTTIERWNIAYGARA